VAAYYNEFDPFAAAWLRELIKAGLIADGEVDERSITDVQPNDVRGFTQCHFFAGIGGWSYALRLAGWPDDRPVWTGSCPCQPFSAAGTQKGTDDPRHLWPAWYRLIRECKPAVVFGEQVESAVAHGWLDLVCDDLEGEGYAVGAVGLPAASVGAPHIRQRLWFVAESIGAGSQRLAGYGDDGHEPGRHDAQPGGSVAAAGAWDDLIWLPCRDGKARPTKPGLFPLAHGFWYTMADVFTVFCEEAAIEVAEYAKTTGCSPEEAMRVVQETYGTSAVQRETAGQGGVPPTEVLFYFLQHVAAACDRASDGGSCQETRTEASGRVLRDLRSVVSAECASLRREPEEQPSGEPANALLDLSRFLARCCEACWRHAGRENASDIPMKINRVGLLRGAGNAIVPEVAAAFIECYVEAAEA